MIIAKKPLFGAVQDTIQTLIEKQSKMENQNKMFQVLKDGLSGDPQVFPYPSDLSKVIDNPHKPWFVSLYQYNEEQRLQIEQVNSFRGIQDTSTEKLFFDLDSTSDLDKAKNQTGQLIERLINDGFELQNLQVYFSGKKGFSIEIDLLERLTPTQVKNIIKSLSKEFSCLDVKVTDPVRIIRVPNTKHDSGLYKIPLDPDEILNLSIDQIKELAKQPRVLGLDYARANLPAPFKKLLTDNTKKPKLKVAEFSEPLDFKNKPKEWRNCKWSLLQGNFKSGERHQAMTIIAATCRGLGYDRESAYYLCKSAIKKQFKLFKQDEFSTDELWENILQSIYAQDWKGGQYSCKSDPWLENYCDSLGEYSCKDRNVEDNHACVKIGDMQGQFKDYAVNFESNVIKTGIDRLDENTTLCASTVVGLLGQPGAGKTSMAVSLLRHNSIKGIPSIFLSLDMGLPVVFAKLIQKNTGMDFKSVLELFKNDPEKAAKLTEQIKKEYNHVNFNFTSGIKVDDIGTIIKKHEQDTGLKPKLVVIDYLECIAGEYSDPIANTGIIANKLKDIANTHGVCILLLLQTQKHSTPEISDPLLSLKGVKGSSIIEQSLSTILTLWREGYNPETTDDDNSISFAVVKNRFGGLWRGDFHWDGVTGNIRELTQEESKRLKDFKFEKKRTKDQKNKEDDRFFS